MSDRQLVEARQHSDIKVPGSGLEVASPLSAIRIFTLDEIEALPDPEWLIEGVLPQESLAVLYGEPGCGKTFLALSMALSVASESPWIGRKTRKGAVLYVAAEGVHGIKLRVRAYRKRHEINDANVRILPDAIQLREKEKLKALCRELQATGFRPTLVILDTFARMTVDVDENNAKDMGEIVDAADRFRKELGATVLLIHHSALSISAEI